MISIQEALVENVKSAKSGVKPRFYREGDYYKDGLLYCGNCHTPKQFILTNFGNAIVDSLCDCMTAERDAKDAEIEAERKHRVLVARREKAFPEKNMINWNFENDDQSNLRITTIAKRYVDQFPAMYEKGKGLLLYGGVGTGKTYMAACIANALVEQGYKCYVTNFSRLINEIGAERNKQKFLDDMNRNDLIVIDDLSAERDTEYMNETVMNVIDSRYRAKKPLIVTTNLSLEEMYSPGNVKKQRVFSRLLEMTFPINVIGQNRRNEKAKEDNKELARLLGI